MQPLTVYKASAGSGKTFTLAVEFIKLLILNPRKYENILAVTFTNKATEEMKHRIVSQLYGLSHGLKSSDSYLNKITKELDVSEDFVRKNADIALHNLLHNYNQFRVQTIDAFFQSILRNMVKELGLGNNLRISLNDSQVISEAVDSIMETLDKDKALMSWIIEYVNERMDDQKSWDITGEVKSFGMNLSKEFFKSNEHLLKSIANDKDFFKRYKKAMTAIIRGAEAHFKECGEYFLTMLSNTGYDVADLAFGKTGVAGYFLKLKDGNFTNDSIVGARVLAAMNDPMKWGTKKNASEIAPLAESQLIPYLIGIEKERQAEVPKVRSAQITLKNINKMRLLFSIREEMDRLNKENARFMLSNTQMVLSQMIQEDTNIAPFIYEKIGAYLQHIMIDEFQDTSTVQWKNFKVLLEETMSHDTNLIVGDVKQSIYRWRSGDWRLLNNIQDEFSNEQLYIDNMDTNFRSAKNIIDFNNNFFIEAAEIEYQRVLVVNPDEAEQLKRAYADVKQETPKGKKDEGLVRITLLPSADYDDNTIETVINTVRELKSEGIAEHDICILVRSNRYIPVIADAFMRKMPEVNIVSDEAFRLDASLAVNTLILAFRSLVTPSEPLIEANLRKAYNRINGTDDLELPLSPKLLSMTLTDMAEEVFSIFHLEKLDAESAYICTFYDQLSKFLLEAGTDLDAFLTEWDDNIYKKTIQSDHIDGIRMISIHKSKGLEFANVIIPYCDWRIEMNNTIWCYPDEEPFDELPIVPVNYSKKMHESIYADDYAHEHLQNCVDNLNLLYVAFTRARNNLFVIGRRDSSNSRSRLVQDVLAKWDVGEELQSLPINYEYGQLLKKDAKHEEDTQNKFLIPEQAFVVGVESHKNAVTFRQSNQSLDFVHPEEESSEQSRYIKMGNVLHNLFSTISTTADIPRALRRLESEGILYDEDVSAEKLSAMLARRFENPQVASWFAPGWTLFNECSIISITPEGEVRKLRPDRVMTDGHQMIVVDFKFGRRNQEYNVQVKQYMDLLCQMGHTNVKGYLWYVYNNQIEEVR